MSHQVFLSTQKNNNSNKYLMQLQSVTEINSILEKSTISLLLQTIHFKDSNQYLVSESHDWSIGRRPESLLVGCPIGAEHSRPQQQNRHRPPSGCLHWSFPAEKAKENGEHSSTTLQSLDITLPRQYIKAAVISVDKKNRKNCPQFKLELSVRALHSAKRLHLLFNLLRGNRRHEKIKIKKTKSQYIKAIKVRPLD